MKRITNLIWLLLVCVSMTSMAQTARVQVIHNSPDLANASVDVYLNDELLLDNFHFRTATPFVDVPAGVPISIDVAPSSSSSVNDGFYNLTTTLTEYETYILVANGIVSTSGYAANQPFGINVLVGGREGTPNGDNTDVVVFHGSPDAPAVDVVELSVPAGTIVNDIAYGNFSSYLELTTANYVLAIRDASGTNTVATYSAPLADLFFNFDAVTVVASGFLDPSQNSDGPGFGLWVARAVGGPLLELPLFHNPTARLQVIHNSPDLAATTVDVYLNGEILLDDFAFRTATPFIDAPASVAITIDIAPGNSTSVAETLFTATTTLAPFQTYIAIANGIISPTGYSPSTPFSLNILTGGREGTAVEDFTDVVVFHGSTDAPTVDVVETSVPAGTVVNDLAYGNFSSYLELPTANYQLDIRDQSGSTTVATYSAPLADLFFQLDAVTVVASGFLDPSQNSDGPGFGLWVARAVGGPLIPLPLIETPTARLQVIHNSPDLAATTVDVYVNGEILLDDFAFRTSTPFVDVPAGVALSFDVAPGNSTSAAQSLYNLTTTLAEGETYIAIANGIVSPTGYSSAPNFALSVFAQGREAAIVATNTDVLVNHGSPDAPTVDVVETSVPAGTIVNDLSYPNFAGYLPLPTLDFVLDVRDATGTTTVASYQAPLQTLGTTGQAITVVASGFLDPSQNSDGPAFGLWVATATGGDLIPLPLVETPTARLQVIHNSPDLAATTVDVYVNGEILLDDFAFRTSTPFVDVPAGVALSIDVAPGNSTSAAQSLYNLTTTLAEGETYIAIANGIVSPTGYSTAPNFALSVFAQGREAAIVATNTDVLVNHGSPDAPTVDVVETSVPAGTIVNDLSYPSFAGYLPLPTLDFVLDVRDATGTTTVASYQAPLQTLGTTGQAITVVASGFLDPSQNSDGPAFGLWVATATGGDLIPLPLVETPTARLQVIHNSPDLAATTVDVYVNGEILLDDFAFRTATPFVDVPAGVALSIDVAPGNSTSAAESLYNLTTTLAEGETYIAIANGIVSPTGYSTAPNFALSVFAQGREAAIVATNTDVLVNHGSPDAPTVDVVETSVPAGTIVNDLSYPNFAGYLPLPTLDFILDVRDATGTTTVASYQAPLQTLGTAGQAITVVASGFLDPSQNSDGPAFGLWVATATGGDLIPLPLVETPTARLQVIHNSPDLAATTVDVYVNGEILLDDFAFRTATPFVDVPAGVALSIDVAPGNSTSAAESLYNLTTTLAEGETYIAVANGIVSPTGYSSAPNFALAVFAQGREAAIVATNTDVLVNHGSPDAPTVDVVETSVPAGTIVNDLSYPNFAGYLPLPTLDFILDVRDATGTVTVASYQAPLQTLGTAGQAITVVASGFLDPTQNSNGPAFGLWVAFADGGNLIPLPEIPLSVDDIDMSVIRLYPNPAKEMIQLSLPANYDNFEGTIFDLSGRSIKTITSPTNIDVNELSSGMYILKATLDNVPFEQKFIKD